MTDQPTPTTLDDLKGLLVGLRDGSTGLGSLHADTAAMRADLAGLGADLRAEMDALRVGIWTAWTSSTPRWPRCGR